MRSNILVYISGAISANTTAGTSIEGNIAKGVEVYLDLMKRGIPAFAPHLSAAFPSAWTALPYESWLAYDFAIIDRCTHMLMMPDWHLSKGAVAEQKYATVLDMSISYSISELLDQLRNR